MEPGKHPSLSDLMRLLLLANLLSLFECRSFKHQQMKALNRLDTHEATSDPYYNVDSPFSLPPYEDVMGPTASPQDYPPFCVYPPFTTPLTPTLPFLPSPPPPPEPTNPPILTPNPPEYPVPSPPEFTTPGPPEVVPNPPEIVPSPPAFLPPVYEPNPPIYVPSPTGILPSPPPPESFVPSPTGFVPSPSSSLPPPSFVPSPTGFPTNPSPPPPPSFIPSPTGFPTNPSPPPPPSFIPSPTGFQPNPSPPPPPPGFVPSPPEFLPGPPIFLPPVVYPAPTAPPPRVEGGRGRWCVAKPTVPDPIIQEAMNYACGSGADCDSIQPNGMCYQPDTVLAHASFAFNSYWQRTKVAGATCDFGGTAMIVTKDPSYDGCHFIIF